MDIFSNTMKKKRYILIYGNKPRTYIATSLLELSDYIDMQVKKEEYSWYVYVNGQKLNNSYSEEYTEDEVRIDVMKCKYFKQVLGEAALYKAEPM